ncbi:histidine acid phosphatase [Niveomyces insectorum RCEF 264]|uniref:Histidine acid phosphatase n=1 Tax=Niveomyces insectorum RCEF 264 TaxID=1081102 RepID=A0A167QTP9_9HYPO|nr:histidine acid phosphatase [Niveomyces insectorum RCEF 264]
MLPISGARWVVRLVTLAGCVLAVHLFLVAYVWPSRKGTGSRWRRPWPLSLQPAPPGSAGSIGSSGLGSSGLLPFTDLSAEEPPAGSPWYPPRGTALNNLTAALAPTTRGVYGFWFHGSALPPGTPYGTYNWCNMPHVRPSEYVVPSAVASPPDGSGGSRSPRDRRRHPRLRYVEVLQRHHKRTPYAANLFPQDDSVVHWTCDADARVRLYAEPAASTDRRPGAAYFRPTYDGDIDDAVNPFLAADVAGTTALHGSTCQFPQLTAGGLADAWQHGADLYAVYHDLLGFLPDARSADWHKQVAFRVTNNPLTSQTASMVLGGMVGQRGGGGGGEDASDSAAVVDTTHMTPFAVEPPGFDSLEPHVDHYYDTLAARLCHADQFGSPPGSSSRFPSDLVDTVFRVGQWEYSRVYRDDGRSLAASTGAWGVWMAQLAAHLRTAAASPPEASQAAPRYRHNVAHDGSMSRLLSILQVDEMVWPGMGSEVVVELWAEEEEEEGVAEAEAEVEDNEKEQRTTTEDKTAFAVRVLFGGQVLRSSHPDLGLLDMLPLDTLLAYIDGLVGPHASLLPAKCNGTLPL